MSPFLRSIPRYNAQQWRAGVLIFGAVLLAHGLTLAYLPASIPFYPASGIALAGLFLGGLTLWPFVLLATLIAAVYHTLSPALIVILPLAETLQALAGAYLLRAVRFDPIFRRYRDTFYLMVTTALVSLIIPILMSVAGAALGETNTLTEFWRSYISMVACLLIVVPFLLRWFAKPRFSRSPLELLELVAVFGLLIGINIAVFLVAIETVAGVPTRYFLLIPFFWLALRHRPRFVSLGLLITATYALAGVFTLPDLTLVAEQLFAIEVYLITIATIFFIVVSVEEDRRVNTNVMRSQLSMLENAVARVSSESKAKNDFIAILAHELRNPLAPIVSSIDFLKLKPGRDKEESDMLALMENRMETVKRLLDDLLDISRISEGKIAVKREPMDLESIVRRAIVSTEHLIKERHQTLVTKFPKKRKFVMGDPVRLEQIFSNLLGNASKYSNPGTTITLQMQRVGDEIEVAVKDEGIGIAPAHIDSIFTPFHQLEEGGRGKKGLGIGLALVKSFVEMHGGSVTAASAGEHKGSTFTVRFPLMSESEPLVKKANEQKLPVPVPTIGLSVLVVDDNDAAAAGIGRLLELRGCSVTYAYDGGQAIERAAEVTPDVVLLDVGLPDQTGYQVAQILRARGYAGRLIALTGFSTDDARDRAKEAGFDHHLIKPIGFAELSKVIPELG